MKLRNLVLPALSVAGMAFAVVTVRETTKPRPEPPLAVTPARSPFARTLAGAGIIEPSSLFVDVASPRAGLAVEVGVEAGGKVKKGDVLFRVDPRTAEAAVVVREAELMVKRAERDLRQADVKKAEAALAEMQSKLGRLVAFPRPEDLPPLAARLAEAERGVADDEDRLRRAEELAKSSAVMERDVVAVRNSLGARRAARDKAAAELALLRAGTWAPDVAVAEAAVQAAVANLRGAEAAVGAAAAAVDAATAAVAAARTELDLLTVRAPIDATVLLCDLRAGEYVGAERAGTAAPVVLGALDPLHIRVDLDENDAGLYRPGVPAKAFVRGRGGAEKAVPLTFVRVEPYVVPKKALTGSVQERVDVRVLQLIYRVDAPPEGLTLYCGQQVDVYLDDPTSP